LSAAVGEIIDAAIIAVIVIFCAVLGFVQEYRAEKALQALKCMLSTTITVLRDGKEQEVLSREIVPGDIMLLEAGDKIPADGRLIKSHSLRCDEAVLTGESVPVSKFVEPLSENSQIGDRKNMVFTGTTVIYGRSTAVVTDTGMNTAFGKIAKEVSAVESRKTPLEIRTEEIGKWLGIISMAICFLVVGVSIGREYLAGEVNIEFIVSVVIFAIALAVAAVPEALVAIVSGALAIGMRQMAKHNALIRKMPAVETLGCTTVICTDKTGTLTRGEMTVRKIFAGLVSLEVTGSGYIPEGEIKALDSELQPDKEMSEALRLLLYAGTLCNDADLLKKEDQWIISGDPTEAALVVLARKAGLEISALRLENPRVEELPFSSERMRMTTIHDMKDSKKMVFMKGAPRTVLERCTRIHKGSEIVSLSSELRHQVMDSNEEMAGQALRVLGFACLESRGDIKCSEDSLEKDMIFLGLVGMIDPPRVEAAKAVEVCRQVHIKPVMITGDNQLTAVAVAKEVGIFQEGDKVLTGAELEKISQEDLEKIVRKVTVYARVSPMDKLKIVKAWKRLGEVVAMTGDGVNDAPALKHADIGIAMGLSGTEVSKEAADMVLVDDNFATIIKAIELGRWIYDNIKKYLVYLLQCNFTEVAVIGGIVLILGPEFLPLLPAAILYINLATDGLPALALGISPPDKDIMHRPPRDPNESVFSREVRYFILLALMIEIPFFYFLFFYEMENIAHTRTLIFCLFIAVESVIALNCRSLRYSVFSAHPHRWLLAAIGWELILVSALIQFSPVRDSFGILIPTWSDLGIIVAFSLFVFLCMEMIKVLIRRSASTRLLKTN
jgi:Ca2+-transporting ATPase